MPIYEEDLFDDRELSYAERCQKHEESARGRDEMMIFGTVEVPRTEMEALLEDMLVSSLRRIPLLEPMHRQANAIYPYVWDLMRLNPSQRRRAVRKPPFRNLSLADLLLDESSKALQKSRRRRRICRVGRVDRRFTLARGAGEGGVHPSPGLDGSG